METRENDIKNNHYDDDDDDDDDDDACLKSKKVDLGYFERLNRSTTKLKAMENRANGFVTACETISSILFGDTVYIRQFIHLQIVADIKVAKLYKDACN